MEKVITPDGLVLYDPMKPKTIRLTREESEELLNQKINWESADEHCEIAHIELTNKCNRNCSYCYNPKQGQELSTKQFLYILKVLADYGVFQVTFGGGDPFCEPGKLNVLVPKAKELGLNVCLTTNGDLLYEDIKGTLDPALNSVDQINVSYHGDAKFYRNLFMGAQTKRRKFGFKIGVNFCCRTEYLWEMDDIAEICKSHQFELTMLVHKPVKDDAVHPRPSQVFVMGLELNKKYGLDIAVDGSCIGKCMAAKKFVDIHADGNVSVCSFERTPIGNVLTTSFSEIWKNRPRSVKCPYFELTNRPDKNHEPLRGDV